MLSTHIKVGSSPLGLLRLTCYLPWNNLTDTPNHAEANFLVFYRSFKLILKMNLHTGVYTCTYAHIYPIES